MKTKTDRQTFEGEIETCCHYVSFRYWDFYHELTPELEAELTEHAEERAKQCIIEGCSSGELNCYHIIQEGPRKFWEEEIRGWWEIKKD